VFRNFFVCDSFELFVHCVVCTCVVHKRCHQDVVTICPGVKQASPDEFNLVRILWLSSVLVSCYCYLHCHGYIILMLTLSRICHYLLIILCIVLFFILHPCSSPFRPTPSNSLISLVVVFAVVLRTYNTRLVFMLDGMMIEINQFVWMAMALLKS